MKYHSFMQLKKGKCTANFLVAKAKCLTVGIHAFKNAFTWNSKPHVIYLRSQNVSLVYVSFSTLDRPLSQRHSLTLNELQLRKSETLWKQTQPLNMYYQMQRSATHVFLLRFLSDHEGPKKTPDTITNTYKYIQVQQFYLQLAMVKWTETVVYCTSLIVLNEAEYSAPQPNIKDVKHQASYPQNRRILMMFYLVQLHLKSAQNQPTHQPKKAGRPAKTNSDWFKLFFKENYGQVLLFNCSETSYWCIASSCSFKTSAFNSFQLSCTSRTHYNLPQVLSAVVGCPEHEVPV